VTQRERVVTGVLVSLTFVAVACSSGTSAAPPLARSAPSGSPSSDQQRILFDLLHPPAVGGYIDLGQPTPSALAVVHARYAGSADAGGDTQLEIGLGATGGGPSFSPTVITGTSDQTLDVTVSQRKDPSSAYRHNFSVPALGIDRNIAKGPGHSITVSVTLPTSGFLVFFCKFHVDEGHAGAFVIG